jgi:hypothetical protein
LGYVKQLPTKMLANWHVITPKIADPRKPGITRADYADT